MSNGHLFNIRTGYNDIISDMELYIVLDKQKKEFLKKHNSDVKVMGVNEFFKHIYENFEEAHFALIEQYGFSYAQTKSLLKWLGYVNDNNAITLRLKKAYEIKLWLQENGYYRDKPWIIAGLKNYDIRVHNKVKDKRFNLLSHQYPELNIYFEDELFKESCVQIKQFDFKLEQVIGCLEEICQLLDNGVSGSNIKLVVKNSDTQLLIEQINQYYKLPINVRKKINYPKWTLDENHPRMKMLQNQCITVYPFKEETKQIVKNGLLGDMIQSESIKEAIEFTSIDGVNESDIVFILDFHESNFPGNIKKLDLTDQELEYLSLNNGKDYLENELFILRSIVTTNPQVYFMGLKNETLPTIFSNVEVVPYEFKNELYSQEANKIRMALYEFYYDKYNIVYQNGLYEIEGDYNTYSHQYNGTYKPKTLSLSYTTLNNYNLNPFSFYVTQILKLNDPIDNFQISLGTFLHEVFEEMDYEKVKEKWLPTWNAKEKLLIDHLEGEIQYSLNHFQNYMAMNRFDHIEREVSLELPLRENVKLKGKVDFFGIKNNHFVVIDFKKKTETAKKSLKDYLYGINNQFFMYFYLIKKNFPSLHFSGVFYQYLLKGNIKVEVEDNLPSYEVEKNKSLLLDGFGNYDVMALSQIDPTLLDENGSQFTKYKLTKNNELNKTNYYLAYRESEGKIKSINELFKEFETVLESNIHSLLEGDFKIAQLVINDKFMDQYKNSVYPLISYADEDDINRKQELKDGLDNSTTTSD